MPIYTDLRELKTYLEIDPEDVSEDKKLGLMVEQASQWIEELINRPGMMYKVRTEYYKGKGTPKLTLRSRPVYATPTIVVNVDDAGFFGSASGAFPTSGNLTYGDDFCLDIDQDDETSRSGILYRKTNFWPKMSVAERGYLYSYAIPGMGNIKVTYYGGYTVNNLPASFRLACNILVARMRQLFPTGMELSSESYEERSVSYWIRQKNYLLTLVKPIIWNFRNWVF